MLKNVYLTELITGESPSELVGIRKSIREKLISNGIQLTTNVKEAHFIVVFFTVDSIRRLNNILSILPKLPMGHSVVVWDHKQYPPGDPILHYLLSYPSFDDQLALELEAHVPDPDADAESQLQLRHSLRYMYRKAIVATTILRDGRYIPIELTDTNSVIDEQVKTVTNYVNPLSIDFPKFIAMESNLLQITDLITNFDDGKSDTQFLVISGCAQTHDITTITKGLPMTYMLANPTHFHCFRYMNNCLQYRPPPPLTLADGLLAYCLRINLAEEDYHERLLLLKEACCNNLKVLLILEGISSLDELKEIVKLGDLCNKLGYGSMVILSTGLDIFRDFETDFKSHDSVFLGYVDGGASAGQTEYMDDVADEWRPFCLKLNVSQLGDVIEMAECRARGGKPNDSISVGAKRGVAEGVNEPSRGRIEEALGDSKRFKLT